MKVAIIAIFAGVVERGVENLAWYLKRMLPFETKVFSIANTDWTTGVPYNRYVHWHRFIKFSKETRLYRALYQLEKINPCFDIFTESFLDVYSFSKNIGKKLYEFNPNAILNISGSTIGYFLMKYRQKTKTKFISISAGGKNISEIKNANTCPDIFTIPTPSAKRYFEKKNLKVRIELVPWGGDSRLFSKNGEKFSMEEIKEMSKIKDSIIEHPIVLSTSALEKYKRIDYLIKAMYKLGKGSLVVVGDGSQKMELIHLGRKLLGGRFIYLGVLKKDKIHKIYNTCDIFCLPNIGEYFGCVFVEALLSGLPVVANDDEDKRYITGEKGGVLTDVNDIDKIADAIRKAYNTDWDDGPRKQGEKFSWDKIIKQYENLIAELVR